jgi:2-C-methyl-D-erythritol 4-phosphate cytidylyltransferase/2-C-methyl-D-erythritol 2,4-cyclodiphosphate synthase
MRTGTGFDVHAFGDPAVDGTLWLCGVELPGERPLKGHSDADVGLHSLTDAIYGALAEGDIGHHFPPSDPQWKGAASPQFLEHAVQRVRARGGEIINVDLTLICEQPKIGPHREAMRKRLAAIMNLSLSRVAVKATTTEGLGFTGRGEGIAAQAAVSLKMPAETTDP